MRLITNTLASVGFLLAGVNAVIQDLAVPKTIRPGDKFNITGHQTSGQGYGEILIMFGVQDSSNPSSSYYPGEMGSLFAGPFDLGKELFRFSNTYLDLASKSIAKFAIMSGTLFSSDRESTHTSIIRLRVQPHHPERIPSLGGARTGSDPRHHSRAVRGA